jgi:hypothetical protein
MSTYARGGVDPHEPLDAVLRVASAPGFPEELAGMDAAAAAFREAAPQPRKRSVLVRVLTVKALVVGAVAVSTGVVLAAAGGVLPIPRPEPTVPSDRPAVTETASVPAVPPPGGPATSSRPADDPSQPTVGPRQGADPPCAEQCHQPKPSKNQGKPDKTKPEKGGGPHASPPVTQPPPGGPPPGGATPPTQDRGPGRASTPGSPPSGAVNAVPPIGAEPPSQGD